MLLLPKFIAGYSGVFVDAYGYSTFFIGTALLGVPVAALMIGLSGQPGRRQHRERNAGRAQGIRYGTVMASEERYVRDEAIAPGRAQVHAPNLLDHEIISVAMNTGAPLACVVPGAG